MTPEKVKLLACLIKSTVNNLDGVKAKQFRAKNHKHLDAIDHLEHNGYIERKTDNYRVSLRALPAIEKHDSNAKEILNVCEKIFQILKAVYFNDQDEKISLDYICDRLDISRSEVNTAIYYISHSGLHGGYTTDFQHSQDAWIIPSENVLRFDSFREAIDRFNRSEELAPQDNLFFQDQPESHLATFGTTTNLMQGYISDYRIRKLKTIDHKDFDLARLTRICEELNSNYQHKNYIAVGVLQRILLDHVPPILGFNTFREAASNYRGKSLKDIFQHLENGCRKIADNLIHQKIRKKESLPNRTQVNHSQYLDALLAEIIRKLEESNITTPP